MYCFTFQPVQHLTQPHAMTYNEMGAEPEVVTRVIPDTGCFILQRIILGPFEVNSPSRILFLEQ